MLEGRNALLVDLNNFARYPTIPIGYLASILRQADAGVSVFSPLSVGATGVTREPRVQPWGLVDQRMRYWSATTRNPLTKGMRELARQRFSAPKLARDAERVVAEFRRHLDQGAFDIVLVSSYLMYFDVCGQIAALCEQRSVPVIIGGPYFAQPEVREAWCRIDGLTALIGGEIELQLPEVVARAINGQSLADIPGVWEAGTWNGAEAAPLPHLDLLPYPDYSDFPWHKYPQRIVPIITGRGCGWGACTFCSDVTSTAGRRYRSRSPENVLGELEVQRRQNGASQFVFTDLKLNSNPVVWESLAGNFQAIVPGGSWVGSVHVDRDHSATLSEQHLRAAAAAGMVRLTTGLESGSQRVLDAMKKGVELEMMSAFLRNAAAAGISVRVTMIVGYPGEEADDVWQTAKFLREHSREIERVLINRFQIMSGTRLHRSVQRYRERFPAIVHLQDNHRMAQVDHHLKTVSDAGYRRQIGEVLSAAHQINRRPLRERARDFEGVM